MSLPALYGPREVRFFSRVPGVLLVAKSLTTEPTWSATSRTWRPSARSRILAASWVWRYAENGELACRSQHSSPRYLVQLASSSPVQLVTISRLRSRVPGWIGSVEDVPITPIRRIGRSPAPGSSASAVCTG